jgi:hypothetical protein
LNGRRRDPRVGSLNKSAMQRILQLVRTITFRPSTNPIE